jgi:hypothetical protein
MTSWKRVEAATSRHQDAIKRAAWDFLRPSMNHAQAALMLEGGVWFPFAGVEVWVQRTAEGRWHANWRQAEPKAKRWGGALRVAKAIGH